MAAATPLHLLMLLVLVLLCVPNSIAIQMSENLLAASLQENNVAKNGSSLSDQLGAVNASGQKAAIAISDFNETAYQMLLQFNETVGLVDKLLGKVQKGIGSFEITGASPQSVEDLTTYLAIANETLDLINQTVFDDFWNLSVSLGQMSDEITLDVSSTTGEIAKAAGVNVSNSTTEELEQSRSNRQVTGTSPACEQAEAQIIVAQKNVSRLVILAQDLNELAPSTLDAVVNASNSTYSQVNDTITQIVQTPGLPESMLSTLQSVQKALSAVQLAFVQQADNATETLVPVLANATAAIEKLPPLLDLAGTEVQAVCDFAAGNVTVAGNSNDEA